MRSQKINRRQKVQLETKNWIWNLCFRLKFLFLNCLPYGNAHSTQVEKFISSLEASHYGIRSESKKLGRMFFKRFDCNYLSPIDSHKLMLTVHRRWPLLVDCKQYLVKVSTNRKNPPEKQNSMEDRKWNWILCLHLKFLARIDSLVVTVMVYEKNAYLFTASIFIWKSIRRKKFIRRQKIQSETREESECFVFDWIFCLRVSAIWWYLQYRVLKKSTDLFFS